MKSSRLTLTGANNGTNIIAGALSNTPGSYVIDTNGFHNDFNGGSLMLRQNGNTIQLAFIKPKYGTFLQLQ